MSMQTCDCNNPAIVIIIDNAGARAAADKIREAEQLTQFVEVHADQAVLRNPPSVYYPTETRKFDRKQSPKKRNKAWAK